MTAILVVLLLTFIIGLCVGSFLNVVIIRALSGESVVHPASKCPSCGEKLKWYHNIPVFSYIFLRGKCAYCKDKISIQYPIVEFITGIVFVLTVLKFGINLDTLFALVIASLLIVIAGTDWREKLVFDRHTYALLGVGLLYNLLVAALQLYGIHQLSGGFSITSEWIVNNPLSTSLLGILAGVIIMELAARLGFLLVGTRAFGEGDTYIAAGLGAVFGWRTLVIILVFSVILQVIFTLPVFIKKLICARDWKTFVPLAVFFLYAVAFLACQAYGLLANFVVYLASAIILALLGLYLCVQIIMGLKKNPEDRTYLPFGPAMAIAGLLVLLF